jgi:hypothetical protein
MVILKEKLPVRLRNGAVVFADTFIFISPALCKNILFLLEIFKRAAGACRPPQRSPLVRRRQTSQQAPSQPAPRIVGTLDDAEFLRLTIVGNRFRQVLY